MRDRDCQANMKKVQEEMRNLVASKGSSSNSRLSHTQLAEIRKFIPREFIQQGSTNDYDRINLTLLNEYLNKYAEKICRATTLNPALIKLDFGQFDGIMSGAENLNPY